MKVDFHAYLVTDRRQAPEGDLMRAVRGALDGGILAVQLREKDLPGGELLRLAGRMRELTDGYGARLFINDRIDVAMAVGADGVHLGSSAMPASAARRLLGREAIIGCSTHNAGELRAAAQEGADFVTFGPVYHTPSKSAYGPPVGLPALSLACGETALPVFALGGVGHAQVEEVVRAGAFGVALISAVIAAPDPRAAALELTARLSQARERSRSGRETAKEGEP